MAKLTGTKVPVIGGASGVGFAVAAAALEGGAEAAEAYSYLMRATYVTGQIVRVDGGGSLV